jgi:hypothetical protein
VKCNGPAHGRTLLRKLNWRPWWAIAPALIAPLFFVIAAGVLSRTSGTFKPWVGTVGFIFFFVCMALSGLARRRADVHIGLCPVHWRQYRRDTTVVMLVCVPAIMMFVAAITVVRQNRWAAILAISFLGLIGVSIVYGVVRTPLVRTRRITKEFVWLRGVSSKYLADLPEWTGNG